MEQLNTKWTLQPQELENDYFFNGKYVMTATVNERLRKEEIDSIINQTLARVKERDGADYLQVFTNNKGDKIYFIDQLSKSMLDGNDYTEEQKKKFHYATILFSHEY